MKYSLVTIEKSEQPREVKIFIDLRLIHSFLIKHWEISIFLKKITDELTGD